MMCYYTKFALVPAILLYYRASNKMTILVICVEQGCQTQLHMEPILKAYFRLHAKQDKHNESEI